MIYSTTSTYRLSAQTAYAFKALDTEAATIYTITLDRNWSECDGAGGVVADFADDVVRGVNGN
jgi:hypothetical protein